MSSVVFLISMGLVIYFLILGNKQDRLDREEALAEQNSKPKKLKRHTISATTSTIEHNINTGKKQ